MQEDNPQTEQPSGGADSPQQPVLLSGGQKVIQPSPELVRELQEQQQLQPIQPTVVSSEPIQPSQPVASQSAYPQPSVPADGQMQSGMSASQLGLNTTHNSFEWGGLVKKAVIIGVILVVVGGGFLFIKSSLTGLSTKTLTNGGYSYTFQFKKSASEVQLSDGSTAYKYLNSEIAGVKPTNDPALTSCSQMGSQWTQAFIVQIAGSQHPVCTPNNQTYSLFFTAQNHNHLFAVTFSSQQTSAAYPELQTIFGSVNVSH